MFQSVLESLHYPIWQAPTASIAGPEIALTVRFDGGWPYSTQRVLRNSTLETWEAAGSPPVGSRPGEGDIVASTSNGEAIFRYEDTAPREGHTGNIEAMCLYAGTGCSAIADIPSAGELVERLWKECTEDGGALR
jgi:nitronate monooxygenase